MTATLAGPGGVPALALSFSHLSPALPCLAFLPRFFRLYINPSAPFFLKNKYTQSPDLEKTTRPRWRRFQLLEPLPQLADRVVQRSTVLTFPLLNLPFWKTHNTLVQSSIPSFWVVLKTGNTPPNQVVPLRCRTLPYFVSQWASLPDVGPLNTPHFTL